MVSRSEEAPVLTEKLNAVLGERPGSLGMSWSVEDRVEAVGIVDSLLGRVPPEEDLPRSVSPEDKEMSVATKNDPDIAFITLRQSLKRLDALTKESQIHSSMKTTEAQYAYALKLHTLYYQEKGESLDADVHVEWEDKVGDAFVEVYTRAAQNPHEVALMAKLVGEKADISLLQLEITKNVEALTGLVAADHLGHVVHAGIVAEVAKVDAKLLKLEEKVEDYLQTSLQDESINEAGYAARSEDFFKFRLELVPRMAEINATLLLKKPSAAAEGEAVRRVAYATPFANNEAEDVQPVYLEGIFPQYGEAAQS